LVEVARTLELLPGELRPHDRSVALDETSAGVAREDAGREADHGGRIREAEEDGEGDDRDAGADDVLHQCISPSTIGPSVSAGKIIRPAVRTITPMRRTTNVGPSVRNVPADAGTIFFWTSEPPIASAARSGTKRPRYSATVPNEAEKLVAP